MAARELNKTLFDGVLLGICFILGVAAYLLAYYLSIMLGATPARGLWYGAAVMVIAVVVTRVLAPAVLLRTRFFRENDESVLERSSSPQRPVLTTQVHRG